jgi:hypothetical protein
VLDLHVAYDAQRESEAASKQFADPLFATGLGPWVITYKFYFYYRNTTQRNLTI